MLGKPQWSDILSGQTLAGCLIDNNVVDRTRGGGVLLSGTSAVR